MRLGKKLSTQLMLLTFVIVTVIMALIMVFQYLFFDALYIRYKVNKTERRLDELVYMLEDPHTQYIDYQMMVTDLGMSYDTYISVLDEKGLDYAYQLALKQSFYAISARQANGEPIDFVVSESMLIAGTPAFLVLSDDDPLPLPQPGDVYFIVYVHPPFAPIQVLSLMSESAEWSSEMMMDTSPAYGMEEHRIQILSIELTDPTPAVILNDLASIDTLIFDAETTLIADSLQTEPFDILSLDREAVDPLGNDLTITAWTSLENVEDAAAALMSYFPYFMIGALVLALLLAWLYARRVSRPITQISQLSQRMAQLDLTPRATQYPDNEIGTLADNLNNLGASLNGALTDLQQANAQLQADIEEKKAQEAARKTFVANVSHELKTPLGIIRCCVESLRDDIMTKEPAAYYDDILNETQRMTYLIKEMLELSKVESGDLQLDYTVFPLQGLIEDNMVLHQLAAEERGIQFHLTGTFPPIHADVAKLDSALTNLLLNAIQHGSPHSDILIHGRTEDSQCHVTITNDCPGIDPAEAQHFFDRFYIGDRARHDSSSGLGLAICAAIFDAHGMPYGINSNGQQITLFFTYPIAEK